MNIRHQRDRRRTDCEQAFHRLRFLDWVDGYLMSEGIQEPSLDQAIARARRKINHPIRHKAFQAFRRGRQVARGAISWPPALRARLTKGRR